jgi:hypothetical protein
MRERVAERGLALDEIELPLTAVSPRWRTRA